jgi:hypothetical protein
MAEYKVTINATPSKAKVISVSPKNVQNTITASPDTSLYFSNLSKKWATEMDGMVLNEDYSSKYYANVSAQNAQISQTNAQACEDTRVLLQGEFNQYSEELEEIATENTAELNTVAGKVQADTTAIVNKGKLELNAALNTLENNIEQSIKEIEGATLLDTKVDIDDMVLMDYVEAPFYQKSEADNRYVNATGDTITGRLLFNNFTPSVAIQTNTGEANKNTIISQNTSYDSSLTTAPSSNTYIQRVRSLDKNAKEVGCFETVHDTSNNVRSIVRASRIINGATKTAYFNMGVRSNNKSYTQFDVDEFIISGKNVPYIKERVISGTSWYEVWSDGWIEQGGITTDTSDIVTYNLLKSFSNTNYTLTLGCVATGGGGTGGALPAITNKTTSSFSIHYDYYNTNKNKGVNWYACGK